VIYITEEQAAEVKYLLEQAIQGNHVLFDAATLRDVTASPKKPDPSSEKDGVERHIEKVMSLSGIPEKRAYLERLDRRTFERVVRTYLNIVENTLIEAKGTVH
jgi:hypothetical protein